MNTYYRARNGTLFVIGRSLYDGLLIFRPINCSTNDTIYVRDIVEFVRWYDSLIRAEVPKFFEKRAKVAVVESTASHISELISEFECTTINLNSLIGRYGVDWQ
jgi:hypothetical protein